jgi:Uma2 family endonuclease
MALEQLQSILAAEEDILAVDVPYETWLAGEFGRHTEWVNGAVIRMSPVTQQHSDLNQFLEILLLALVSVTGGGRVFRDPMVMRGLPNLPGRQPDLQVVLPDRLHLVKETEVAGAANLVIEIISRGSVSRDRGEKFNEYEQAGVPEYWMLDSLRKEPLFYVLGEDGLFRPRLPVNGVYTSVVLPRLKLPINLLWRSPYPDPIAIVEMVKRMVEEEA